MKFKHPCPIFEHRSPSEFPTVEIVTPRAPTYGYNIYIYIYIYMCVCVCVCVCANICVMQFAFGYCFLCVHFCFMHISENNFGENMRSSIYDLEVFVCFCHCWFLFCFWFFPKIKSFRCFDFAVYVSWETLLQSDLVKFIQMMDRRS